MNHEIYTLPPILQGTAEQQLRQLRDYLVRIARQQPGEGQEQAVAQAVNKAVAAVSGKESRSLEEARQRAATLRDLIVKTANEVYDSIDKISTYLNYDYRAESEFGSYLEQIHTSIEQTAKNTVENYQYMELVEGQETYYSIQELIDKHAREELGGDLSDLDARTAAIEAYQTEISGEIRRGFIDNPRYGEEGQPQYLFGIAIGEKVSFTGETETDEGIVYQKLDGDQTMGFYTSTGWQYWSGGTLIGWFDSQKKNLHTPELVVDGSLGFGDDWLITTAGGWGLRYIGG